MGLNLRDMQDRPFATERTRSFRAQDLNEVTKQAIEHIEVFGLSVLHVTGSQFDLPWSYTTGIYDTCGQPEVIAIGLGQQTAHFLLNEAAERLRQGVELTHGRHRGLVGEVECEFRPVTASWRRHLRHRGNWFYRESDFPVLQAVYPDLNNVFPEEDGFDKAFAQPLLQTDSLANVIDSDFWASNDPNSSLFGWKFPDPPRKGVCLSSAVHEGREAVVYVSRDAEDGVWQFHGESMSGGEPPVISCFHHVVDADPSIKAIADLPLGWWAERSGPNEPWVRYQHEPDSGEDL